MQMGQDYFPLMKLETKRFLWFIGFTFTLILAFQYFELPYGNVLVNLFYSSKIPMSGDSGDRIAQPLSSFEISSDNVTSLNKLNSTDWDTLKMENNTKFSEEQKTDTKFGFLLKPQVVSKSNKSSEFYELDKVHVEDDCKKLYNGSATKHAEGFNHSTCNNDTMGSNISTNSYRSAQNAESSNTSTLSFSPAMQPKSPAVVDPINITLGSPIKSKPNMPEVTSKKDENFNSLQKDDNGQGRNSPVISKVSQILVPEVTSISEMNKLMLDSHLSYRSMVYY